MIKISLDIPVILDGITYKKGTHEVPKKSVTNNKFFDLLVSAEKAVVLQTVEKIKSKIDSFGEKLAGSEVGK